jgi:hypothetical protein
MSSYRNWTGFAAAAALAAAVGVAGTPAHALIILNAFTSNGLAMNSLVTNSFSSNALTAQGSALADLNGVAAEAVTLPERAAGALVAADDWEARQ